MLFWLFMLFFTLLIPFTMLGLGKYFLKQAPKNINTLFGYRTERSMKNRDTWEFAHKYCGKIWYHCGLILLPVTGIIMLFLMGKDVDTVGMVSAGVVFLQTLVLAGSIFPTERALKKNFDRFGFPR